MSKMDVPLEQDDDDLVQNAQAICNCLAYLARETERFDLPDAARFIEMAYHSVLRTIPELEGADYSAHPGFQSAKPGGLPN